MSQLPNKVLNLPVLPLREVIIFPYMVVPLFVGREKSIWALEEASRFNNELFLVSQKDANILGPDKEDLFSVGTVASIIQMLRLPDNTIKVLIEGRYRARLVEFHSLPYGHMAKVAPFPPVTVDISRIEAHLRSIKTAFETYVKLNAKIPQELLINISNIADPERLCDFIVAHLTLRIQEKQKILEAVSIEDRLQILLEKIHGEIEIMNIEKKIRGRIKSQMEKSQKEYYLNEQMNAIQKELGQKEDGKTENEELEEKLHRLEMPLEARIKTEKEIKKLKSMSPMSAESAVIRNYVDWVLSLPWNHLSIDDNNLLKAENILEEEHFGLKEVKERILEYLAVRGIVKDKTKGTILCLWGPPGVGKTSIVRSIATALNRKFVRISLGGVRDEAEIRGHRRTYVGAMPGKIIHALKKAQTSNPVILLDEIDKMSSDFRGDPSSAMLEVLDPEQNKNFSDHYLELDYDLSKVLFVMTANDLSKVPGPLRDRMEIITISGYTPQEKLQIAKKYLLKKAEENNGLDRATLKIQDSLLLKIISSYTKEAGVRELERVLQSLARKVATKRVKELAENKELKEISQGVFSLNAKNIEKFLGPEKFISHPFEKIPQVGVVNGLAYTPYGGDVLHIEVLSFPGNGKLLVTGKLGEVMQESAKTALSFVRSLTSKLGVSGDWFEKNDLHIHVPEGATPKDGPSAGITMATAITSAITGIKVLQVWAMTGEITLRGKVLAIGGLKEKLLAAKQQGITHVVIPVQNAKDLVEIPQEITQGITIYSCSEMEQVLRLVLDLERPEAFLQVINGGLSGASLAGNGGEEEKLPEVAN